MADGIVARGLTFVWYDDTIHKNKKEARIIFERMSIQSERLKRKINELQTLLKKFPEGNLICAQNGNHCKWYRTDGTNHTYIPKDQRALAEQLAAKKYHTLMLEDLQAEYRAVQLYLKNHKEIRSQTLLQKPEYEKLLKSNFRPLSQELFDWMNESYEQNYNYPEQLVHKTSSGILVRSKSESLIVMFLYMNKIPFRYECKLSLNETIIYPDFTIRHPKNGKVYYWEHFGMMDQPAYAKKTCSKLQLYISHGIVPSMQLITTYENKEQPLSPEVVENIIQQYFL